MKLLCRCPYCNGLFEAADYSEKNVVCRWCGNDVGVAEYVEADFDEREILDAILADRKKLEEEAGVEEPSLMNLIAVPAIVAVPVVLVLYKLVSGGHIAWYLWVLGALGLLTLCYMPAMYKQTNRVYNSLKELVARKNGSLTALADEIAPLKARAAEIREEQDSEADFLEALAEALGRLVRYAYSKARVREQYAAGDAKGVRADGEAAPAAAGAAPANAAAGISAATAMPQQERLVYIQPPQRCPACNHIYTTQELAHGTVVCPDCGLEIDLVDEHARTEVQAMVRRFFEGDKKLSAKTSHNILLWMGIGLLALCAGAMITSGIEHFFFSWWVLLLFLTALLLGVTLQDIVRQRALAREIREGMNDLFELEMFVAVQSPFLKDDFTALKAEIVKKLKKD